MKKFIKMTFMWIGSFVVALGFVYGAGTLIKNLTQTATKGDIVTSDWVNAVNSKLGTSNHEKGGLYGLCRSDGTITQLGGSNSLVLSPMYQQGSSICNCPSGFTKVQIGAYKEMDDDKGRYSSIWFSCYKN
ncbi:MAG: hypothetical protein V3575_06945 [Candidatus Absconditabacteria bacterium]